MVDEAYIDFGEDPSLASQVLVRPNLVVLQTCSKSFGMAGVRLGMAFASEPIVAILDKVRAPYNISQLTSMAGLKAFDSLETLHRNVKAVVAERHRVAKALEGLTQVKKVYPSDANFILFRISKAREVYSAMAKRDVIIRDRSTEIHCENCLRVTIGTPELNSIFLSTLKEVIEELRLE